VYEGFLYKRAFVLPLLRCTTSKYGKKILEEIHERKCRVHIRGRASQPKHWAQDIVGQLFEQMLLHWWRNVSSVSDSPLYHQPSTPLRTMPSPLPFQSEAWTSWSFPKGNGAMQVLLCSRRLLYQMGRSERSFIHYWKGGLELHIEEYHHSLWSA